jgi:hypothetical protein
MTEFEFLQVNMQVTQLCSNTEYREAFHMSRRQNPEEMAKTDKNSDAYAAIRLLIGTWDRISIFGKAFNAKQRQQFFRHHPVSLVWQRLEPATKVIRRNTDERFAKEFEDLHKQYQKWTASEDGREFRTAQQQAIGGLFFV